MASKLPFARVVLKLEGDEISIPVPTHEGGQRSESDSLRRIATEYRDKSGEVPVAGRLIRQRDNATLATWAATDGFGG